MKKEKKEKIILKKASQRTNKKKVIFQLANYAQKNPQHKYKAYKLAHYLNFGSNALSSPKGLTLDEAQSSFHNYINSDIYKSKVPKKNRNIDNESYRNKLFELLKSVSRDATNGKYYTDNFIYNDYNRSGLTISFELFNYDSGTKKRYEFSFPESLATYPNIFKFFFNKLLDIRIVPEPLKYFYKNHSYRLKLKKALEDLLEKIDTGNINIVHTHPPEKWGGIVEKIIKEFNKVEFNLSKNDLELSVVQESNQGNHIKIRVIIVSSKKSAEIVVTIVDSTNSTLRTMISDTTFLHKFAKLFGIELGKSDKLPDTQISPRAAEVVEELPKPPLYPASSAASSYPASSAAQPPPPPPDLTKDEKEKIKAFEKFDVKIPINAPRLRRLYQHIKIRSDFLTNKYHIGNIYADDWESSVDEVMEEIKNFTNDYESYIKLPDKHFRNTQSALPKLESSFFKKNEVFLRIEKLIKKINAAGDDPSKLIVILKEIDDETEILDETKKELVEMIFEKINEAESFEESLKWLDSIEPLEKANKLFETRLQTALKFSDLLSNSKLTNLVSEFYSSTSDSDLNTKLNNTKNDFKKKILDEIEKIKPHQHDSHSNRSKYYANCLLIFNKISIFEDIFNETIDSTKLYENLLGKLDELITITTDSLNILSTGKFLDKLNKLKSEITEDERREIAQELAKELQQEEEAAAIAEEKRQEEEAAKEKERREAERQEEEAAEATRLAAEQAARLEEQEVARQQEVARREAAKEEEKRRKLFEQHKKDEKLRRENVAAEATLQRERLAKRLKSRRETRPAREAAKKATETASDKNLDERRKLSQEKIESLIKDYPAMLNVVVGKIDDLNVLNGDELAKFKNLSSNEKGIKTSEMEDLWKKIFSAAGEDSQNKLEKISDLEKLVETTLDEAKTKKIREREKAMILLLLEQDEKMKNEVAAKNMVTRQATIQKREFLTKLRENNRAAQALKKDQETILQIEQEQLAKKQANMKENFARSNAELEKLYEDRYNEDMKRWEKYSKDLKNQLVEKDREITKTGRLYYEAITKRNKALEGLRESVDKERNMEAVMEEKIRNVMNNADKILNDQYYKNVADQDKRSKIIAALNNSREQLSADNIAREEELKELRRQLEEAKTPKDNKLHKALEAKNEWNGNTAILLAMAAMASGLFKANNVKPYSRQRSKKDELVNKYIVELDRIMDDVDSIRLKINNAASFGKKPKTRRALKKSADFLYNKVYKSNFSFSRRSKRPRSY